MRETMNRLMYILSAGCQWRAIPKDLPPKSTIYGYFDLWTYDGTLDRIHHALYELCRARAECDACPTATVIDSQSVKSSEKGARIDRHGGACPWTSRRLDPRNPGKKIKGKKRHILVDTLGLVLHAVVHPADVQDRDGGYQDFHFFLGPVSDYKNDSDRMGAANIVRPGRLCWRDEDDG